MLEIRQSGIWQSGAIAAAVALCVLLAGMTLPAVSRAGSGSARGRSTAVRLSGRIVGLPPASASVSVALSAVSLTDGSIAAVTTPAHGRYAFTVSPGGYLLVLNVLDLRKGKRGSMKVSKLLHVTGGPVTANLSLVAKRTRSKRKPAKRAGRASSLARATDAGGGAIGLGAIPVSAPAGSGIGNQAQGGLANGLLPKCEARKRKLLDKSRTTLEAIRNEQKLSDEGHTDYRTHYSPLAPELTIEGTMKVGADGKAVLDVTVRNVASGQIVDHVVTARDPGEDLDEFLRRVGAGVGERECEPEQQPAPPPSPPAPQATTVPVDQPPLALGPAPGHVRWAGSYRQRLTPFSGPVAEQKGSWTAEASFNAQGEAQPAVVSALSGGRVYETCGEPALVSTWELEGADGSVAWGLGETNEYPNFKYVFPATPSQIPFQERLVCGGMPQDVTGQAIVVPSEMYEYPPEKQPEHEALLAPLEVAPGTSASQERSFRYQGTAYPCSSNCSQVDEEMTLRVEADAR